MELDLRRALQLARQRWWLLLLAPLVTGLMAFTFSARQTELYSASAKLLVTPGPNSSSDTILAGQQLAETYQLLIVSRPLLERVIGDLQLPYDVDELRKHVTATAIAGTQVVEVSVSDTDPGRAAAIANAIANTFTDFVGEQAVSHTELSQSSIDEQIAEIEGQIAVIDERLVALEGSFATNTLAVQAQMANLRTERSRLDLNLTDLQVTSQQISADRAAAQTQVTVPDPAVIPEQPYAPRTVLYTALGALAGLLLALGTVALNEYLDNSIKPTTDFVKFTGSPLLATVASVPKMRLGAQQLFTLNPKHSPATEAMRLLRTRIEVAAVVRPITTLAVTSAGPAEGKSTIVANLGVLMAHAGISTVIIDANLRHPTQHRIFNAPNDVGLTTLLTHPEQPWHLASVQTNVTNLTVIPSGPIPPNPAHLLVLEQMTARLAEIGDSADVVLLDTPPILAVSDALAVATKTDGIILVGWSGQTRLDALQQAVESFGQGDIRLVGIVLNRQKKGDGTGTYRRSAYGSGEEQLDWQAPPAATPVQPSPNGVGTWPARSLSTSPSASAGSHAAGQTRGRHAAPVQATEEGPGTAEAARRGTAP